MVEAVSPISATSASSPTRIGVSTSIGSEPDNAWVAARQSQITTDLVALKRAAEAKDQSDDGENASVDPDESDPHRRHASHGLEASEENTAQDDHPTFSGESDRIGTWNFDEDTPFGHREAIV